MRLLTVVLLCVCAFGAYRWWDGKREADLPAMANQNGFVPVEMPDGMSRDAVIILAPPNCPSDEAQRAEAIADYLGGQGIPVARKSSMSFAITNPTDEQEAGVDRAVAVFNGGAPAVFINGMAMSNPTPAQAAAEYRRTKRL